MYILFTMTPRRLAKMAHHCLVRYPGNNHQNKNTRQHRMIPINTTPDIFLLVAKRTWKKNMICRPIQPDHDLTKYVIVVRIPQDTFVEYSALWRHSPIWHHLKSHPTGHHCTLVVSPCNQCHTKFTTWAYCINSLRTKSIWNPPPHSAWCPFNESSAQAVCIGFQFNVALAVREGPTDWTLTMSQQRVMTETWWVSGAEWQVWNGWSDAQWCVLEEEDTGERRAPLCSKDWTVDGQSTRFLHKSSFLRFYDCMIDWSGNLFLW